MAAPSLPCPGRLGNTIMLLNHRYEILNLTVIAIFATSRSNTFSAI
jgi:hypothetical protein